MKRDLIALMVFAFLLITCNSEQGKKKNATNNSKIEFELIAKSEVNWEHLNPARGDKSPSAGTLWGDRNGKQATGYLLKPKDGFLSPPHIHNVSYRGVVISGQLHNDDPNAADQWMPTGSFWTQPAGEVHVTGAKGENALAYIEIEDGPYLVWPKEKAFDNGERAVNIDKTNIVWLSASDLKWNGENLNVETAFLWGRPKNDHFYGCFVKLPTNYKGKLIANGNNFKAIVISGTPMYSNGKGMKTIETGSYFGSKGSMAIHKIEANTKEEVILYIRTNGKVEFTM